VKLQPVLDGPDAHAVALRQLPLRDGSLGTRDESVVRLAPPV
jgi:hypothetical protein